MTKKIGISLVILVCFLSGIYIWKIRNSNRQMLDDQLRETFSKDMNNPYRPVIAVIGDMSITTKDVDWEYNLLTRNVHNNSTLTPIPDLGDQYEKEMKTLRNKIVSTLIERKTLYSYVKGDATFDSDNAARFQDCLQEWQATISEEIEYFKNPEDQERLKVQLCEKSLISQYFKEKFANKTTIPEEEITEYFKNHTREFEMTKRVVIRQIVLATEEDANKVKHEVNQFNFADLAKQYSIAPERENGGRLGPFAMGEMPRIFDVAFSMQPKQISDTLQSNYGYHIILLEAKLPEQRLTLTEATPRIKEILRKKKYEEEYQKWVQIALDSIPINAPKPLW